MRSVKFLAIIIIVSVGVSCHSTNTQTSEPVRANENPKINEVIRSPEFLEAYSLLETYPNRTMYTNEYEIVELTDDLKNSKIDVDSYIDALIQRVIDVYERKLEGREENEVLSKGIFDYLWYYASGKKVFDRFEVLLIKKLKQEIKYEPNRTRRIGALSYMASYLHPVRARMSSFMLKVARKGIEDLNFIAQFGRLIGYRLTRDELDQWFWEMENSPKIYTRVLALEVLSAYFEIMVRDVLNIQGVFSRASSIVFVDPFDQTEHQIIFKKSTTDEYRKKTGSFLAELSKHRELLGEEKYEHWEELAIHLRADIKNYSIHVLKYLEFYKQRQERLKKEGVKVSK